MKIQAFVAEIFAKQYCCFLINDFQCIFDISLIMHLRSLQRWIITEWLWNFFETRSQNGPISVKWKHQSKLIFCILRLYHKHIDFNSSWGTPCSFQCIHQISRSKNNLEPLNWIRALCVILLLLNNGLHPVYYHLTIDAPCILSLNNCSHPV